MKEERELRWKEENEASELAGMDKNAMREFYKVSLQTISARCAYLELITPLTHAGLAEQEG